MRYPKTNAAKVRYGRTPIVSPSSLARAKSSAPGRDGTILCLGTLLADCLKAADLLAAEGLDVGVVNARFAKPIDRDIIERALARMRLRRHRRRRLPDGRLRQRRPGGGVSELGLDTSRIKRLGLPDRFIEHAERCELLADLGLDAKGIAAACRELAERGQGVASL